uniref:Thioredoxin-like protein AAED1 n=1 Tax=Haliotis discus discus TaxID=91233 RepID=A0A8R9Z5B4_HALDI|nr:thioredoxin-like protein AAED1 [Haliotis discus discus]
MADVEPETKALNEMDEEISMSRGMRAEVKVNFDKCRDMFVYDQMGNKIRFGDVYKKQKTIVVFTRHLLDFVCQEYVDDLGTVPLEYLQEADVRLVIIAPSPYVLIRGFKKVTSFNYTVYCDPDYELFKAMGCVETLAFGKIDESKHIKSGIIMGVLRSTWRAMQQESRLRNGDVKQQGASFIMGPGDVLHHAHIDQNATDHAKINDLLTIAGVQNVSFPKDPRVLDL